MPSFFQMASGQDTTTTAAPDLRLTERLRARYEEILRTWESDVRQLPVAGPLDRPRLLDHVPQLLQRIIAVLEDAQAGREVRFPQRLPDIHALDRLDVGYDLHSVISEFSMLRQVVLRLLDGDRRRVLPADLQLFNALIDDAVAKSVHRYSAARERTLRSMDRLSAEALGTGDLDAFLPRLLNILVETTESVDTAGILLREGDRLHLRAAIGLDGELATGFSLAIGEGFSGHIAATRAPHMVRSAATDPLVISDTLKRLGVRAMYGVPLEYEGDIVGVAHVGSLTAYDFSDDDRQLFRTMARRVTSLIVQAQLIERERASHQEAQKALALVNTLLSNSPVGLAFLGPELRYQSINAMLAEMNGLPVADHLGRTVREVLGDDANTFEPLLLDVIAHGRSHRNIELEAVGADGSPRTILANYYPVRTGDGVILGVGAVVVDITDRKQAHEQLQRAAEILELGDAFFTMDRDFRITRVNANQERISSKTRSETLGRTFWELWPEAANPSSQYWQGYHRAMNDRVPVRFEEYYAPLDLWTDVTAYPMRDGGLAVFFRDASERKRAEAELRRAVDFRERFLGIVGHDLRNPLGAIKMSASLLAKKVPESVRVRESVDRITGAADRISRMIDDLLDFTRGRLGGGIPVQPRDADMAEIAQDLVDELRAAHPDRDIQLEVLGDTHGRWDPDRAAQALGNLVANSLRHGDPTQPVKVTVRASGGDVLVDVWNAGTPIPLELQARLFEPFNDRVRRSTSSTGLGLGLYIVKEIVVAHGGRVEATSTAEGGTTFTTAWPRRLTPPSR